MSIGTKQERKTSPGSAPAARPKQPAPVRVAVIGCGAISSRFHLPVLAGHAGVKVTALVDPDVPRAQALATSYGVERVLADAAELTAELVDAAVVATPPFHHAPCCIDLARKGIHVFVEKPMAITAADAQAMADAARTAGVALSVGHFRRLFPAVRLLRSALDGQALGRVIGFDAEEGDEYGWCLATLSNLRKSQGGGGVLIDIGSHVLDLLLYLFPGPYRVLAYRDNGLGGVETDCRLDLRLSRDGAAVEGRVELSRTRRLRSTLRIVCEHGTLELRTGERYQLAVIPNGVSLLDPDRRTPRDFQVQASWADEPQAQGYQSYRAEIDDWLEAIHSGNGPRLCAASAMRTVALIEECYRTAARLDEPWVWEGPKPSITSNPSVNGVSSRSVNGTASAGSRRSELKRVLVTGATGFIGCRLAELLHLSGWTQVRALVHRPASAARLARLPVEMVQGDLKSAADMRRAVEGCDAVVHCAVGTAYGQRREVFAVTVGGTRAVAEAARAAGVRRFVHLSSIAVHSLGALGIIDDTTPVAPLRGDDYSESKAAAEEAIGQVARAGLPAIVLRPGNVYGPYSKTYISRPLQYLARNGLVLAGCADRPSNTVYVDNLIHAIRCALEAPAEVADGRAFVITDPDELTWGEFYSYFADALGYAFRVVPEEATPPGRRGWRPFGWLSSFGRATGELVTSPEFRALGKRFLEKHPFGKLPRWMLERWPWFDRRVRTMLRTDAVMIYRPVVKPTEDVLRVRSRFGAVRCMAARQQLGFEPPVLRARAMDLTLQWVREARLA